ncbi:MAG: DUF6585 family protein [Anaerolineales bacterium]
MANQLEDDGLKDLQAKMNATKAKGKNMDKEDDEDEKVEEEGNEDEFIEMLESQASDSLMTAYHSNPQCVNPQFLNQEELELKNGNQKHAWGQSQPEGSVLVPMGFEQVIMLGPAIVVYPPFVVYRDGLAYLAGGKQAKPWRFEEVAAISINNFQTHATTSGHHTQYTLTRTGGESLVMDKPRYGSMFQNFDDVVKRAEAFEAAVDQIRLAVFKLMTPRAVQSYEAGEALKFGPVTIQQNDGIQLGNHHYAWGDVQNIEAPHEIYGESKLKVALNNGKRDEMRISEIPNFELLCRLIGLNLDIVESTLRS